MFNILSIEHSARISSWDQARREFQKSKKLSNRVKIIGFVAFNVAAWSLFLAPLLGK